MSNGRVGGYKIVCVILILALSALEFTLFHTRIAERLRSETYVLLNSCFRGFKPKLDAHAPRATIIDISLLERDDGASATAEAYTPPKLLGEIIKSITTQHRPQAIAVDVDLSPVLLKDGSHVPPGFVELMSLASELTDAGIPVYFGVDRAASREPKNWLRDEMWARHAVWLRIPSNRELMIPVAVHADAYEGMILPSMAAAMAGLAPTLDSLNHGPEHYAHEEMADGKIRVWMALTDLNLIEQLKGSVVPCDKSGHIPPILIPADRIDGRLVFIGNVSAALDQFKPPGFDHMVPGILLHAAGALTLERQPLQPLNHVIGAVMGVVAMLGLLFWDEIKTAGKSLFRRKRSEDGHDSHDAGHAAATGDHGLTHDIQHAFTSAIGWSGFATVVGVGLFIFQDVLWLELVLVLFFAVIHTLIECWVALRFAKNKSTSK